MDMTGTELRQLLLEKWGRSYDLQLRRVGERILLLVMWKFLEQSSFPLSEQEYIQHLDGIAAHLQAWGVSERVAHEILACQQGPRLGKAVTIRLNLSGLGERASEWLL